MPVSQRSQVELLRRIRTSLGKINDGVFEIKRIRDEMEAKSSSFTDFNLEILGLEGEVDLYDLQESAEYFRNMVNKNEDPYIKSLRGKFSSQ